MTSVGTCRKILAFGAYAMLFRGVVSAALGEVSLRHLHAAGETPGFDGGQSVPCRFRLIVPVLFEQAQIESSYDFFRIFAARHHDVEVVFVTTEVEERRRSELAARLSAHESEGSGACSLAVSQLQRSLGPEAGSEAHGLPLAGLKELLGRHQTTNEVMQELMANSPTRSVFHLHYCGSESSMAKQVNVAALEEFETELSDGRRYFVVYNVDSRPEMKTIVDARARIRRSVSADEGYPPVMQQSSSFLGGAPQTPLSQAAGLTQTRWTFGTEVPRLLGQSAMARKVRCLPVLAICVGHGLFVEEECFRRNGGLPTFVMQEDLAYGFMLSALGVPVYSLGSLDTAETPTTLSSLNQQKQQWFWSYLEYPRVAQEAVAMGAPRGRVVLLLVQAGYDAVLWLGTSPAMWATLLLPILDRRKLRLSLCGLGFYVVWPQVRHVAALTARGHAVRNSTVRDIMMSVAVVATDSVGPFRAIASMLRRGVSSGERLRTPRA